MRGLPLFLAFLLILLIIPFSTVHAASVNVVFNGQSPQNSAGVAHWQEVERTDCYTGVQCTSVSATIYPVQQKVDIVALGYVKGNCDCYTVSDSFHDAYV